MKCPLLSSATSSSANTGPKNLASKLLLGATFRSVWNSISRPDVCSPGSTWEDSGSLGHDDFDKLCYRVDFPICLHWSTCLLGNTSRRGMHSPDTVYYCKYCPTRFSVKINPYGSIELHISRYVGFLADASSSKCYPPSPWIRLSYHGNKRRLNYRCKAFADWLERMYHPETGAVFNGGQFEMFKLGRRSESSRN